MNWSQQGLLRMYHLLAGCESPSVFNVRSKWSCFSPLRPAVNVSSPTSHIQSWLLEDDFKTYPTGLSNFLCTMLLFSVKVFNSGRAGEMALSTKHLISKHEGLGLDVQHVAHHLRSQDCGGRGRGSSRQGGWLERLNLWAVGSVSDLATVNHVEHDRGKQPMSTSQLYTHVHLINVCQHMCQVAVSMHSIHTHTLKGEILYASVLISFLVQ